MTRRWVEPPPSPGAEELASALRLPLPVARILAGRGHRTVAEAEAFLNPALRTLADPMELPGMEQAAARLWRAIRSRERIVLFGDYDVDGITSLAILVGVLGELGADVKPFLPHRIEEGYGLTDAALQRCVKDLRPALVVAVDCGTTSVREVRWLREQGIDVVIVDHHEVPDVLPPATAMVNPHLAEGGAPLCSAGLAFKVAHALLKSVGERSMDLRDHLDLVALGTVADIAPLVGDNRVLVRAGLARMAGTRNTGLRELMDVAGVEEAHTTDVAFRLGPRLNAAGRLGDAKAALELLTTRDRGRAGRLARELDESNRVRQQIERQTLDEAMAVAAEQFDPDHTHALVLARRGWHLGVIGIVASRLQKHFWRPTFVIGIDDKGIGKGSGRSVEGCHLVEGLRRCADNLLGFGGHELAAGLNIHEDAVAPFAERLNAWAGECLTGDLRTAPLRLDAEVRFGELDAGFLDHVERLAPFGAANPEPVFFSRRVRLARPPSVVGKGHLRAVLAHDGVELDAIGFNMGSRTFPPGHADVAFALQTDDYWGDGRVQLRLLDFVESE